MGLVKNAVRVFKSLTAPSVKAPPPDKNLVDPLVDDLKTVSPLEPASAPETESPTARAADPSAQLQALIDEATDVIIDNGGTAIETYDAFAETMTAIAGPEGVQAAKTDLMSAVQAADKRVARSFADTVKGHGGAGFLPSRSDEEEEEEEEESEADVEPPAEEITSD